MAALAVVLNQHPDHPLDAALRATIHLPAPPPPRLDDLLHLLPHLPRREHPVEALRVYLDEQTQVRSLLERRLDESLRRLRWATQVSNILAGVAAILLFWGLFGWASALGFFEFPFPDLEPATQQDENPQPRQRPDEDAQ